jgi:hypothetical protein
MTCHTMGLLDFYGTCKNITYCSLTAFDLKLMLNPCKMLQAMPWQCMFTLSTCILCSLWILPGVALYILFIQDGYMATLPYG